jgi:hypothetical protein
LVFVSIPFVLHLRRGQRNASKFLRHNRDRRRRRPTHGAGVTKEAEAKGTTRDAILALVGEERVSLGQGGQHQRCALGIVLSASTLAVAKETPLLQRAFLAFEDSRVRHLQEPQTCSSRRGGHSDAGLWTLRGASHGLTGNKRGRRRFRRPVCLRRVRCRIDLHEGRPMTCHDILEALDFVFSSQSILARVK